MAWTFPNVGGLKFTTPDNRTIGIFYQDAGIGNQLIAAEETAGVWTAFWWTNGDGNSQDPQAMAAAGGISQWIAQHEGAINTALMQRFTPAAATSNTNTTFSVDNVNIEIATAFVITMVNGVPQFAAK